MKKLKDNASDAMHSKTSEISMFVWWEIFIVFLQSIMFAVIIVGFFLVFNIMLGNNYLSPSGNTGELMTIY